MKLEWDYTNLADSYLKRPDYSDSAVQQMLDAMTIPPAAHVCDIGAGTGILTLQLAKRAYHIVAIEPNEEMRERGVRHTSRCHNATWCAGTADHTGQPDSFFDLVTFGSSFDVIDRNTAIREAARILQRHGWFACMWNYRDLDDPIQAAIERSIKSFIPSYAYGTRREDQTSAIRASALFQNISKIEASFRNLQSVSDCLAAWRSHLTLRRQAGASFDAILNEIAHILLETRQPHVSVPYTTRIWIAQLRQKERSGSARTRARPGK